MKHSFFGGVHPAGHKESTRRKPIARLDQQPEQVVLPVLMSPLGRAEPLVRPGDRVQVVAALMAIGDELRRLRLAVREQGARDDS